MEVKNSDEIKFIKKDYFFISDHVEPYQTLNDNSAIDLSSVDSRVLLVSHIWETINMPDPLNEQFIMIKDFLAENDYKYVFYDYSSIPQRLIETDWESLEFKTNKKMRKYIKNCIKMNYRSFINVICLDDMEQEMRLAKVQSNSIGLMNNLFSGKLIDCEILSLHSSDWSLNRGWPFMEIMSSLRYGLTIKNLSISNRFIKLFQYDQHKFIYLKDILCFIDEMNFMYTSCKMLNRNFRNQIINFRVAFAKNPGIFRMRAIASGSSNVTIGGGASDEKTLNTTFFDWVPICIINNLYDRLDQYVNDLSQIIMSKWNHVMINELCSKIFTNGSDRERIKRSFYPHD